MDGVENPAMPAMWLAVPATNLLQRADDFQEVWSGEDHWCRRRVTSGDCDMNKQITNLLEVPHIVPVWKKQYRRYHCVPLGGPVSVHDKFFYLKQVLFDDTFSSSCNFSNYCNRRSTVKREGDARRLTTNISDEIVTGHNVVLIIFYHTKIR